MPYLKYAPVCVRNAITHPESRPVPIPLEKVKKQGEMPFQKYSEKIVSCSKGN